MKATAIILAGGKSTRLGRPKALETIGGTSIVERVIRRIQPLTSRVLIVTGPYRTNLPGAYGAEFLADLHPGCGPLGGIYTGLAASQTSLNIVVACDTPFLNTGLLEHMMEISDDFEAVVPRFDESTLEPLHAIYSRNCLGKMLERLESGQLSVQSFVKTLRVKYIGQAESQRLDPDLRSFFNINYESDLAKAIAIETEIVSRSASDIRTTADSLH